MVAQTMNENSHLDTGAKIDSSTGHVNEINEAPMSDVIPFPVQPAHRSTDLGTLIDRTLARVPSKAREKIRFEFIKTVDSYDAFFTQWSISLPDDGDDTLEKQLHDIAHQEHDRKMRMLPKPIEALVFVLTRSSGKSTAT